MKTMRLPHAKPRARRWTRDEYYQMADLGWFEGQRVELIEGRIVEMPPQTEDHYATIHRTSTVLSDVFGEGHVVRSQAPMSVGVASDPEPDVAVVRGALEDFTEHPTSALLVVEVSLTTLLFDRRKAGLYAKAGVPDYWILNLPDRQVEVRREPIVDDTKPFGFTYRTTTIYQPGETVTPLSAPSSPIAVNHLLPKV
ncbi:MAG TPA: Uma2 family endonuclease [Tepidisphaeraceae bacterium]|nr:Uma2 family endonuclease [Tepidisphaeraceae bacterium]